VLTFDFNKCFDRIAMELYEAVSRRMGIPEVVIRVFMGYMRQSRIFVVTFLGVLDPIQRTISTPQGASPVQMWRR